MPSIAAADYLHERRRPGRRRTGARRRPSWKASASVALASAAVLVGFFVVRPSKTKGRWGIGSLSPACPRCGTSMPAIRRPASIAEAMWGGWTCPKCGCKVDKFGHASGLHAEASHPLSPASWRGCARSLSAAADLRRVPDASLQPATVARNSTMSYPATSASEARRRENAQPVPPANKLPLQPTRIP